MVVRRAVNAMVAGSSPAGTALGETLQSYLQKKIFLSWFVTVYPKVPVLELVQLGANHKRDMPTLYHGTLTGKWALC